MDRRHPFYRQAALVVRVLPHVARRETFALKAGTAIDPFLRDLPRLSIDIDLAWLPRTPRAEALPAMWRGLDAIATDLKAAIPGIGVQATDPWVTAAMRLSLASDGCRIEIEVSPAARGTIWPVEMREVAARVEESLGYSENRLLSFNDLYAGKRCRTPTPTNGSDLPQDRSDRDFNRMSVLVIACPATIETRISRAEVWAFVFPAPARSRMAARPPRGAASVFPAASGGSSMATFPNALSGRETRTGPRPP